MQIHFTVAQLIDELKKYPSEAQVVITTSVNTSGDENDRDLDDVQPIAWDGVHDGWSFSNEGDAVILEAVQNIPYREMEKQDAA